jgi:hypothetical protein
MELSDYVKAWKATDDNEKKPCNEDVFIDGFIEYLKTIEEPADMRFCGTNDYGGLNVVVCKDENYYPDINLSFEVNYGRNVFIKVYKANHNGYWTPEYLSMKRSHPRYDEVANAFHTQIFKVWELPFDFPKS